jgi:hypothetical protein
MMFTTSHPTVGANVPQHPEYDTYAVTPSDSVDLPSASGNGRLCRAIYVTGAGNVNVNLTGGGTAVLTGLSAGQRVVIAPTRILATSTTATGILALY